MTFKTYGTHNYTPTEMERVATFLFEHLEKYGDSKNAIKKAIAYAIKEIAGMGGYIFTMEENSKLIGAVVINKTGMECYIPENILVYIATHKDYRGKGLGKKLMEYAIANCTGNIALHVEKDNPAKKLYEKLGFTNPYLEMRLKR